MKKLVIIAVSLAAMCLSIRTEAQVRLGIQAGINNSKISSPITEISKLNSVQGLNAGAMMDFRLNDYIALETGLKFSQKGYEYDDHKKFLNYLNVPLQLKYMYGMSEYLELIAVGGGYFSYGLNLLKENNYDAGIIFGVGVKKGQFQILLDYQLGLINFQESFIQGHHRTLGLSISYYINLPSLSGYDDNSL